MTDTHHFEAFMKAYQDMVYTTAVRLLGNEAEAEDISQEVFLKAYERFDELSSSPTAGGWLKTVARNLCLNHLSRYRARWRFFSEMNSEEDDKDYEAGLPDPVTQNIPTGESDRWLFLEEALKKLPDAQRIPLVLYHFEELPYEEISAHLHVSLSKVKTDIHRGRTALYQRLKTNPAALESWSEYRPAADSAPANPLSNHSHSLGQ
jgi:RNA polymerase sigma-70 factor, ECF subfamily